jgi:hypothetical protein
MWQISWLFPLKLKEAGNSDKCRPERDHWLPLPTPPIFYYLGMGAGAGSPLVFIVTTFPRRVQGDAVRTVFLDFSLQRLTNLSFYFSDNNNYPATSQKK